MTVPRQRILVVDDEKLNRQALAQLLHDEADVILARDGQQALARAHAETPPDLVLLDVMMPEMDGYEVLRRLKDDPRSKDIPVMFVTGLDSAEDEEIGLAMGAVDYVSKPFRPAIIRARVRNHLTYVWQRKELERLARLDGLTRIPNRLSLDAHLDQAWQTGQRAQTPLSVAMIDVDFFKQYNDRYGHGAGDTALQAVARLLEQAARRPADLAARYGGEEFVLLLPDTPAEAARAICEDLRQTVAAAAIAHDRSEAAAHLTISVGGATGTPATDGGPADLLARADAQLYAAKRAGRDRVAWA